MKFSRFDRALLEGAARVFGKLFPDPQIRHFCAEIVAASLQIAHESEPNSWGLTLDAGSVRLNVGRGAVLSLGQNRLKITFDAREISAKTRQLLQNEAIWEAPGRLKTAPHAASATISGEQIARFWPLLEAAHARFGRDAARGFESRAPQSPTWRDAHSPGVLAYLESELGVALPVPAYAAPVSLETASETEFDAQKLLREAMQARGLSFPDAHLAAFFTALSSKGFVILSGPSGVGKTALSLAFAALLPRPGENAAGWVELDAAQKANGQVPIPRAALRYFSRLRAGETRAATAICEGAAHTCSLVCAGSGAYLQLRGAARRWLLGAGATFLVETEWGDEALRPTFRLLPHSKSASETSSNALFLPVRPDWRDEKPLLGYFNPLGNRYEWTPFLRFIVAADARFRAGDGAAHFVVFDEMNLARLEWYFADLLSIMEAPRDAVGRATEPLRFDFDPKSMGELPPRELFLPPNLYFVGTINADETAHPLSPKVLDRAWVLDAPGTNFCNYPPQKSDFSASDAQKSRLLETFTRGGKFAAPNKNLVAAQLELFPARRDDLSKLNYVLEMHGAGFGFRVFDEILTFCAVARQNELWETENAAFDAAIALKIAPRLRGARGQIEGALRALLGWGEARNLAQTSRAATQMLAQLERDGFLP